MTRRIKQEDTTGCGLACIAMLSGKKYKVVRKKAVDLGIQQENKRTFYTSANELKKLGEQFGVSIKNSRKNPWEEYGFPWKDWVHLPNKAIIAINYNKKKKWHWVLFVREKCSAFVLDPKKKGKNDQRTDWGRMKPKGFLPVE
jgi:ABC-type bacteriocin/lantibiotic exporter with double-glycine peptidase domain